MGTNLLSIKLLFLCLAGFIAAIVDAIAGGGGIISLPAYLLFGIPPQMALGTNKFSGTACSFTSSFHYFKFGKTYTPLLKFLIPATFLGAVLGVTVVLSINQQILRIVLIFLIVIMGIYSLFSKNMGELNHFQGINLKSIALGCAFAFLLGLYDGVFGPGAGSFLLFMFIKIYHFDFLNASGNAKVLNFVSNITSLTLFAIHGKIVYLYAVPVSAFMVLGAITGTKIACNKGSKLIKPLFILISIGIALKLLFDYLSLLG
jgi:uncharacterized membrane protein YfcA